jgi:rifampicin phosphotransferase
MLVTKESTQPFAKRECGGKGYNLYLMDREGLPVPEWTVIGKRYYDTFLAAAGLKEKIKGLLLDWEQGKIAAAECSKQLEALFVNQETNKELISTIEAAINSIGNPLTFSVRSSAADEDSSCHSFAGQLTSYLYVTTLEDACRYVKLCWASTFSERCLVYRKENGLDPLQASVAVIIQRMIDADRSGVIFTCDPIEKKVDRYLVSAVYGVGEGLVSGALDADNYWLDAATGSLVRSEIAHKNEAFSKGNSGHTASVEVEAAKQDIPALTGQELQDLFHMSKRASDFYQRPQDIEWAYEKGKLYLLQTRPVTTLTSNPTGYPNLWDNSNIIESYGGVTLPLSFTFALRNYYNVYVQFCEILSVPPAIVKEMDDYLAYMLGSLHGRVYYNLYNWYKLVGVLPGFKQNREFMETMMGVSEELAEEIANRIQPHPSWNTWKGKLRKTGTGLKFIYYHYTIQSLVDNFLKEFNQEYQKYRTNDYSRMSSDQILRVYLDLERRMFNRWKAPIVNDFLCMVHFGLLRKLTKKWLSDLDPHIQNDLIAGEGNLESAEPTKVLIKMADDAFNDPLLRVLIESTPPEDTYEALSRSPFKEFFAKVNDYLDRFGFRCMSEMKLEAKDLISDPSYLFVCLKNYLRAGNTKLGVYEQREQELRKNAELQVANHLKGYKKHVYFWVLKHARKAVRNRENTRFARTRIYGIARTMFQCMGNDLASRGILEKPDDIFYLTVDEVFGIHQGTLTAFNLIPLIKLRKVEYANYEGEDLKPRFMTRGPVYWHNPCLVEDEPIVESGSDEYDLKGTPCCPGILEGVVKVVLSPTDDLTLNGEILVTARTDPGWVPLYPSISGLLVERGSLLSHSAIVAREMGLPAIVAIPGLIKCLKTGMKVRLDGKAGTIKIL